MSENNRKLSIVRRIAFAVFLGVISNMFAAMAQLPGNFVATGNMTRPREGHTATLLPDGRVLIACGGLTSSELYDPDSGTFTATGSVATARYACSATLLNNGKVLIAGGTSYDVATRHVEWFDSAELYDPATGRFSAAGSMTGPRAGHTATLLAGGKVLLAGGTSGIPPYVPLTTAEIYNPVTGQFTATGSRVAAGWADTATLLADGTVLFGAPLLSGGILAAGDLYDPSTGTFTPLGGDASSGYYWHAASMLTDGKVLISGGGEVDLTETFLRNSELYDPTTRKFTASGAMNLGRLSHTSTLLPDSTVLIAGGSHAPDRNGSYTIYTWDTTVTSSAELYDPATGTFRMTGAMTTARQGHTATLLKNGRVLIAGGGGVFSPASAELYDPSLLERGHVAPWLFSVAQDGRGQGAILHGGTARFASASDPASIGEILEIYCSGLDAGASASAPEVTIGGQSAVVQFFGDAPGFVHLNQVNVRVPNGVVAGPAVPVSLRSYGLTSNEVTISVH